ncbi:CD109 antigen-like [Mya arenaria]|uniref:CD109 antigen-like n=1 Tax=Mya arenaria TaxID=6604 RepID=UPI0022E27507|nr:CD109 antigen-like [Mya arenaria]
MALLKGLSFVSLLCLTYGYYYVTLPKYVSPGTPLSVVAHVTQTGGPVSFLAKIVASNDSDVASVRKNIVNDAAESLQIVVPSDLPKDDYKIVVSGSGGLSFYNESKLFYEENILIFIQTDKARYSGGQQVRYRTVFLLPTLANFNGSAVISFYDGNGNRIETRGPTAITDGVIGGALDLSREPVFGDWEIEVKVQQTTVSKQFKVFDYILPKFSVDLSLPQNIKISDQSITISVEARYTFNKEVIGTCTIQIYDADYQRFKLEFEQEIRGTTNFTIAMHDLRQHNLVYGNIKIRAFVTDNATALTMAAETDLKIDVQKQSFWKIKEILDRRGFFPGLTYSTIIRLTNHDDAPHRSGVFRYTATFLRVDKITCPAGSFHKEIINVTHTHLNGNASYDTSGFAVITFLVPSGPIETIDLSVSDRYTGASMYSYLKSFSRYSFPLLRVWTNTPDVMVGDIIDLLVESTEALVGNVTMEFYSRGMMIRLIQAPASNSRIIGINVPISADMFPRVFLMVSHITQSGHILSDNVVIQVQGKPFINKVEVTYNTTLAKPRQSVDMKVTADRGSTVYISVEDERNRLLGSDNDIYANEVIDEVRRVSHNTYSNLERRGGHKRSSTKNQKIQPDEVDRNRREYGLFGDTDDGYMQTGLILLTDGKSFEIRDVHDSNFYSGLSFHCYEETRKYN